MSFSIDHYALWIVLGFILVATFMKLREGTTTPFFLFSKIQSLDIPNQGYRYEWRHLPSRLHGLAILCFVLAFLDPHLMIPKSKANDVQEMPKEGIAIYLVLDQSGSMSEELVGRDANGNERKVRKMDLLKQVTKEFIQKESSNLIGIVAFARIPHVLVPLTFDQNVLLDQLKELDVVKKTDEDGTSMGYAIYKTAHFIASARYFAQTLKDQAKPAYAIKNSIIVLVTDGFQDPNLLDKGNRLRTIELDEASAFAKEQGVRLYVINIDPGMSGEEYAPHRRQLESMTRKTGGDFFLVSNQQGLQRIYDQIDQLEKQTVYVNKPQNEIVHFDRVSFFPYLILLGLIFFFTALCLDTTLLRKAP